MERSIWQFFTTLAFLGLQVYASEEFSSDGFFTPSYVLPNIEYKPYHERDYEALKQCILKEVLPLPRDGGNQAPLFVRFGFHVGAMYNKTTHIGGASQAPARFTRGFFTKVQAFVKPWQLMMDCRARFPWVSYSDLMTLGAATAVEFAGGPVIPWRPGRVDWWVDVPEENTQDIASPAPNVPPREMYEFFLEQVGLNTQETAAIMGGHAMGQAHGNRSGVAFAGIWTDDPFHFTNKYYQFLLDYEWVADDRYPSLQFTNIPGREYMMFNIDLLTEVPELLPYVKLYANDKDRFFEDFALVYNKVLELGVLWEESVVASYDEVPISK